MTVAKIPPEAEDEEDQWVLFNDFSVRFICTEEAIGFPAPWKSPCVIILERIDSHAVLDLSSLPTQLNSGILLQDVSMAFNRQPTARHSILDPTEIPIPGTLIAIDAEFVSLQAEEMEFRADGTKKVLRPSHMSLARVSVLRGQQPREGEPFIDDYILTKEEVVDYLTEYSGIRAGDLDRNNSAHTLVPLKVAYKKLRLLVDLGCVFIGHGLAKDFRTINIFVPPEQVADTVHLFSLPNRQRKLSLRFLSYYLLHQDIQSASHDSIEDAKYAFLLYKLYTQLEREGKVEEIMEEIFEEGHRLGFKPPMDRSSNSPLPVAAVLPPASPQPPPRTAPARVHHTTLRPPPANRARGGRQVSHGPATRGAPGRIPSGTQSPVYGQDGHLQVPQAPGGPFRRGR